MSQPEDWGVALVPPATPAEQANRIQNSLDALRTLHRGPTRPDYLTEGLWIDDSAGATAWVLKYYDGAQDIPMGTWNTTDNTWTVAGGLVNNFAATVAPDEDDDETAGYSIGSTWIDITNNEVYVNADPTEGAAIWISTSLRASDYVTILTAMNSLSEVTPDDENDYLMFYDASGAVAAKVKISNITRQPTPNLLVNGSFEVWQRLIVGASSFAINGTYQNIADQWKAVLGTGSGWTIYKTALTGESSLTAARCQRDSGQTTTTNFVLAQAIESNRIPQVRGKKISCRLKLKKGANFSPTGIVVNVISGTGTDETDPATFTGATVVATRTITAAELSTSAQVFSFTSAAVIPTTVKQIGIGITAVGVGTAGANDWFEVDDVMINEGPVADKYAALPYAQDLLACQRYLPSYTVVSANELVCTGSFSGSNGGNLHFHYRVEPRVAPTGLTVSNVGHFTLIGNSAGSAVCTSVSFSSASKQVARFNALVGTTPYTAGQGCEFYATNNAAQLLFTGCAL